MKNPYASPKSELLEENEEWKRLKLLTIWLWLMLISNLISAPLTLFMMEQVIARTPGLNEAIVFSLALASIINAACVIALLKNKKWGFYGSAVVALYVFVVNFTWQGFQTALFGLTGLFILAALLHLGGDRKAWPRLN